jgi:hypothetical protein
MEAQVLHWLRNTGFYAEYADRLEIVPQFPIGDYLKQLDPSYDHPRYRVDFLLLYQHPSGRKVPVIIEYGGFREHLGSATEPLAAQHPSESMAYRCQDPCRSSGIASRLSLNVAVRPIAGRSSSCPTMNAAHLP